MYASIWKLRKAVSKCEIINSFPLWLTCFHTRQPSKCWAAKYYPPFVPAQRSYFRDYGQWLLLYGQFPRKKILFSLALNGPQHWGALCFSLTKLTKSCDGKWRDFFSDHPHRPPPAPHAAKVCFCCERENIICDLLPIKTWKKFPGHRRQSIREEIHLRTNQIAFVFCSLCWRVQLFSHAIINHRWAADSAVQTEV